MIARLVLLRAVAEIPARFETMLRRSSRAPTVERRMKIELGHLSLIAAPPQIRISVFVDEMQTDGELHVDGQCVEQSEREPADDVSHSGNLI
jgi:hypothetical protein